jgi:hypothetical protein
MSTSRPGSYYAIKSFENGRKSIWHSDRGETRHAGLFAAMACDYLIDAMNACA